MIQRKYKNFALNKWVDEFANENSGNWQDIDSANAWLRLVERSSDIAELVRTEDHNELIDALGYTFGWLCCFVKYYSIHKPGESLKFSSSLSDMMWRKYPGVCYYCTHKFGEGDLAKEGYNACVCLAIHKVTKGEKDIRKRRLQFARRNKRKPITFDQWQKMIKVIYGPNHKHLSLSAICLHFIEEIGEVAESLRNLRVPYSASEHKKKILSLENEIADVFSWILGLLNKLDQILEKSRRYYRSKVKGVLLPIEASEVAFKALKNWRKKNIP